MRKMQKYGFSITQKKIKLLIKVTSEKALKVSYI